MEDFNRLTRREVIKGAAQAGVAGIMLPLDGLTSAHPAKAKLIVEENKKPGTAEWQLTYIRTKDHRSAMIEGYCSQTSVRVGEDLDIFVSANIATDATLDIYRMGYYGGKGGRHMQTLGPFSIAPQRTPPIVEHRLRQCDWKPTTHLRIANDWLSGVYLAKLKCAAHRYESYIIFVVRDDRNADLMFQTSDTTWQAYNKWPDAYSLYDSELPRRAWGPDTMVSYDRPYGKYPQVVDNILSQGSGSFLLWEYPLCYWLEQHGYDVTYWSNIDTHLDRSGLDRVKCFLSIGHDEYWSLNMYEHVHSAVQSGLNVAFLCGNSVSGVIPLDLKNPSGVPARRFYRLGRFGAPVNPTPTPGVTWEKDGPPEELLMGAKTMN